MKLLASVIVGVLKRKALKSVTSVIGTAVAAGGVTGIVDPDIMAAIPEGVRGWVVTVVGIAIVFARHRQEMQQVYSELKAAVAAGGGK